MASLNYKTNIEQKSPFVISVKISYEQSFSEQELLLTVKKPSLFKTKDNITLTFVNNVKLSTTSRVDESSRKIRLEIPSFMKSEQEIKESSKVFADTLQVTLGASVGCHSLTLFLASNLQDLWVILDAMQVISFLALLQIRFPKNSDDFLKVLMKSHLTIVPDFLLDSLKLRTSEFKEDYTFVDPRQRAPEKFEREGFSSNIIENAGVQMQVLVFYMFFHVGLNLFINSPALNKRGTNPHVKKINTLFNYSVFIMINDIVFKKLIISCFLQLSNFSDTHLFYVISYFLAVFFTVYFLSYFFWIFRSLQSPSTLFGAEEQLEKYKLLVSNVNTNLFSTRNMSLFLNLQIFLFCLTLVTLHNFTIIQLLIFILLQISIIILVALYRPFLFRPENFLKVIEGVLMMSI